MMMMMMMVKEMRPLLADSEESFWHVCVIGHWRRLPETLSSNKTVHEFGWMCRQAR
jgi:hypothetical protein